MDKERIDIYINISREMDELKKEKENIRNAILTEYVMEGTIDFQSNNPGEYVTVSERCKTAYDAEQLHNILQEKDLLGLSKKVFKETANATEIKKLVKAGILEEEDLDTVITKKVENVVSIKEKKEE